MPYSTVESQWRAYQFSDPFAAGSFYVCRRDDKVFCRPDCDVHPRCELRSDVIFVNAVHEAIDLGCMPCESCDPTTVSPVNVNLLINTVSQINQLIGFMPPLMDEDEDRIAESIKENIARDPSHHRSDSVGASVSKNDLEHYRLVDLACRHLAMAAAMLIFSPSTSSTASSPRDSGVSHTGKKSTKKRRGGVLGFKELAAKSKLSAWHFHRVFKSVTGMTPKTYGDKCFEHLQRESEEVKSASPNVDLSYVPSSSSLSSTTMSADGSSRQFSTPASSVYSVGSPINRKRGRSTEDEVFSPQKQFKSVATSGLPSYESFGDDFTLNARAFAPETNNLSSRPGLAATISKDFLSSFDANNINLEFPDMTPSYNDLLLLSYPPLFGEQGSGLVSGMVDSKGPEMGGLGDSFFSTESHDFLLQDAYELPVGLSPELLTSRL